MKGIWGLILFMFGLGGLISISAKDGWSGILLSILFGGMIGIGLYYAIANIIESRIKKHELENHD